MLVAIWLPAAPARAQYVEIQSFEVTPFIGARLEEPSTFSRTGPSRLKPR